MSKNLPQETKSKKAIRIGAAVLCAVMALGIVYLAGSLIIDAIITATTPVS